VLSDKRTHGKRARHMTPSDEPERPAHDKRPRPFRFALARERVGAQIQTPERGGGADGDFCTPAGSAGM